MTLDQFIDALQGLRAAHPELAGEEVFSSPGQPDSQPLTWICVDALEVDLLS